MLRVSKRLSFLILTAFVGMFLFGWADSALAKGLTVAPAYVEVEVNNPKEDQFIEFSYTNDTGHPVTLELYPIDFYQKSPSGEISFAGSKVGDYSYSLASFLSFESNTLILAPGETKKYKVKVLNRPDLSPGGHYAAVVARLVQEPGERKTSVAPAISSLVYLRKVGGERFHLTLSDINWSQSPVHFTIPSNITIQLQNDGNVHVIPYGRVEVTDMFGRLVYKGIINESSGIILPQSRRNMLVNLRQVNKNFPLSFYKISINGRDSLNKTVFMFNDSFIYVSWWILVIPVLGVGGLVWWKRKRKKSLHKV